MTKRARLIWQSFLQISLWLASAGLMLASSGLDGAYLTKLMPAGFGWLGLVLNTVSDIVSEVVVYWFGRLRMDASKVKRQLANWLLLPQVLLVGYAWLFGWRQILPILRVIEPTDYRWLAPTIAGFVPIGIVSVGFVQALLAGRIESEKPATNQQRAEVEPAIDSNEPEPSEPLPALPFVCPQCSRAFASQAALNAHRKAHVAKSNGRHPAFEPTEQEAVSN